MAKKKLVPIAKKFAALFALRLELFSALKLTLAAYKMPVLFPQHFSAYV